MLYINYMSIKLEKNKIAKKKIIFLKIFHHKKRIPLLNFYYIGC